MKSAHISEPTCRRLVATLGQATVRCLLASLLTIGLATPASATPFLTIFQSSTSQLWGAHGAADIQDAQSSSVYYSPTDYAKSFAGPDAAGNMTGRAAVGTSNSSSTTERAATEAIWNEDWICRTGVCATGLGGVPVTVALSQDGYFTKDSAAALGIVYDINLGGVHDYIFTFRLDEDGGPGTVRTRAAIDYYSAGTKTSSTAVPVSVSCGSVPGQPKVPSDTCHFSYATTIDMFVFMGFAESLTIDASVGSGDLLGFPEYLDSYNSFHAVLSTDNDAGFESASGRQFGTFAPAGTAPEPSAALLAFSALLGLASVRRKKTW